MFLLEAWSGFEKMAGREIGVKRDRCFALRYLEMPRMGHRGGIPQLILRNGPYTHAPPK